MAKTSLKGKDLKKIGFEQGRAIGIALNAVQLHCRNLPKARKLQLLGEVLQEPVRFAQHEVFGALATELLRRTETGQQPREIGLKPQHGQFNVYGKQHIDPAAMNQMFTAMRLPVAVGGALMPDAHVGYGLPIGGVLATQNAVIPYAVGVDIGCRMCLSIYGMPTGMLANNRQQLKSELLANTRFGMSEVFDKPLESGIMERTEFNEIAFVKNLKDTAYRQLGTSGGGNHFVEFGMVTISDPANEWGLPCGEYVGLLSHSGSRGMGARIAAHYTKLATELCPLPKEARHLAWLDLDGEAGAEYWLAMTLAGDYASECHRQIHQRMAAALGEKPLATVENHHNFAWKEQLVDGTPVVVHRKGATPAGKGVLGIIPGSMTSPGFIVRGKGAFASLNSASHGAGRQLSRRKAKEQLNGREMMQYVKKQGVMLIGGGLDEAPMAYKDIHAVMREQTDLVEVVGNFLPKIVRMAGD